jgi:hypothetical protein
VLADLTKLLAREFQSAADFVDPLDVGRTARGAERLQEPLLVGEIGTREELPEKVKGACLEICGPRGRARLTARTDLALALSM